MLEIRLPQRCDVPCMLAFCCLGVAIWITIGYWLTVTVIGWFR